MLSEGGVPRRPDLKTPGKIREILECGSHLPLSRLPWFQQRQKTGAIQDASHHSGCLDNPALKS
jgi:hypothetical protein